MVNFYKVTDRQGRTWARSTASSGRVYTHAVVFKYEPAGSIYDISWCGRRDLAVAASRRTSGEIIEAVPINAAEYRAIKQAGRK